LVAEKIGKMLDVIYKLPDFEFNVCAFLKVIKPKPLKIADENKFRQVAVLEAGK